MIGQILILFLLIACAGTLVYFYRKRRINSIVYDKEKVEEDGGISMNSDSAQNPIENELINSKPSQSESEITFTPHSTVQKTNGSAESEQEPDLGQNLPILSEGSETAPQQTLQYDIGEKTKSSDSGEAQDHEVPHVDNTALGQDLPQENEIAENLIIPIPGEETAKNISSEEKEYSTEAFEVLVDDLDPSACGEVKMPMDTNFVDSQDISVEQIDFDLGEGELLEESPSATAPVVPDESGVASKKGDVITGLDKFPGRKKKTPAEKEPRRYSGLSRGAPESKDTNGRQISDSDSGSAGTRIRSLPIEIRLRFERGGFCSVSLIATRVTDLPEELSITSPDGEIDLRAMQEEWYQDITPDDISRVLQDGTVWTPNDMGGQFSWSLSGRNLYVLADRSDISGFVSQTCLELGREHAVLCTDGIRSDVEKAIKDTGAFPIAVHDSSLGAPSGWIVFRGVVPLNSVTPVVGVDIFNALRPLPKIEISLESGIRLDYANWLEGYPPLIRVYGDPEHTSEVLIDGHIATCEKDGNLNATGWDLVGSHTIWCSDKTKSYSIVPFFATWNRWDAYIFPILNSSRRKIAICGPMVRYVSEGPESLFFVCVPETNPVLLGRAPGEYEIAQNVSGIHGSLLFASPHFLPVWALPSNPVHCDKKSLRILLIGELQSPVVMNNKLRRTAFKGNPSTEKWCRLILDASRKGMKSQPETNDISVVWFQYKQLAHQIWKDRK